MHTDLTIPTRITYFIATTTASIVISLSGCNSQKDTTNLKPPPSVETADVTAKSVNASTDSKPTSDLRVSEPVIPLQTFLDAALNGEKETIQQAVDSRFDLNSCNEQKRSAVMLAAFNGHTDIVKLLVRNGASLNLRDTSGRTALMFASTGTNQDTAEFLIVSGAELNAVDNNEGFTALMFAAAEGQTEVVRTLLKYKANALIRDADGESALGFATKNGHVETAKLLTE